MISVKRLGHATLTTPDIDRQIAYYTEVVGLTLVERTKDRAFLACKMGLEAIALEPGNGNALSRLAFQVAPETDLGEVLHGLAKDGVKAERASGLSPGVAEGLVFTDPKGTKIEIFSDYVFAKDDGRTAGIMPLKLGHVAYRVVDVQKVVKFYCDVLGFRVSDWRGDTFAFLRCNTDHHTVNFVHDAEAAAPPHRLRGEGLVRKSTTPPTISPTTRSIWSGVRAATSSATMSRPITATPTRCGSRSSPRWIR